MVDFGGRRPANTPFGRQQPTCRPWPRVLGIEPELVFYGRTLGPGQQAARNLALKSTQSGA